MTRILAALLLLTSCTPQKPIFVNSPFRFDCQKIPNEDGVGYIERCENVEAICYNAYGKLSCYPLASKK